MEGAGTPDEVVTVANEVPLGKDIEDVEDGGLGGEAGVRAGGTAVLPGTSGEVSAMAHRPVGSRGNPHHTG